MAVVSGSPGHAPHHLADDERPTRALHLALLLAALLILIVVVLVVPGGTIGTHLRDGLAFAFGWASYLLPVVVGAFTAACFRAHLAAPYRMSRSERIGWIGSYLAIATILQAIDGNPGPVFGAISGGGWLGQIIWTTLVKALGSPGAAIVTGVLALVAAALLFDLTVEDGWKMGLIVERALRRAGRAMLAALVARVGTARSVLSTRLARIPD